MHHFAYKHGVLTAEGVSLVDLAETVGTPFYCYSTETLTRHYKVLSEAFAGQDALICFAVKANSNQAVLATMARLGAGMDVVGLVGHVGSRPKAAPSSPLSLQECE